MRRRGRGLAPGMVTVLLTLSGVGAPVSAQQAPPPPAEPRPFTLPDVTERLLSSGARVLVVPNREMPFVSVNLVLPGGQGADPEGLEGVGLMTATLLESGTDSRSFEEITAELDGLGASLQAGATADWTEVTLLTLADALDPALEVMAEVVTNPTFPEARVELVRRQYLSSLEAQNSQAPSVAARATAAAVYGDHRYGKQTTRETLAAIDRATLSTYHDRWYRPASALFVVAGDVEPDAVVDRLESAFSGWDGGSAPPIDYGAAPVPASRVVLVHRPGAVQAEVRIAHLLPAGAAPEWTALQVVNHWLGSQPGGSLNRELREERGFTYGAGSSLARRVDRGLFTVEFASRNEVAGEALATALGILREARTGAIPSAEFERSVRFLSGSFPLRTETPQQVGSRVATNRLLGISSDALEGYRAAIRAVTPEAAEMALRRAVDPNRATIVVVGDATVLQPQLTAFGPVTLRTVGGEPLSMADLVPAEMVERFDASVLTPGVWRYGITVQGQPFGSLERTVTGEDSVRTVRSELALGPQRMGQTVIFSARDFGFLTSTMTMSVPGTEMSGEVRLEEGRVRGVLDTGTGEQLVDIPVPDGVLVSDMVEIAVQLSDLEVGASWTLPVANISTGTISNATIRVVERTEVTVPAGTFDAFRVELEGADAQTLWVRAAAPHIPLRVAPAGQPILIELTELPGG